MAIEDTKITDFLKYVDKEIDQWGIYKNSPESQKYIKNKIIAGMIQLAETNIARVILKNKLLENKIFTFSELNKALEIPIEKRDLFNLKELLESDLKPEPMILGRGLIPDIPGFILIGGLAKEGKTLLALQLGLSLISGKHFLEEFPVERKCKILYIFHENTKQGLNTIIKKQIEGLGLKLKEEETNNFYLRNGADITLSLKNPQNDTLIKEIRSIKPDVIFLDPLSQFIAFDINKGEFVKRFIDSLKNIYKCMWILIHHERKPTPLLKGETDIEPIFRLLGSSYLANACESSIGLVPEGENFNTDYKKVFFKLRRENVPLPLHLKRDPVYLYYEVIDFVDILKGKILPEDIYEVIESSFNGRASYRDLVLACSEKYGVSERRIRQQLQKAKEEGLIIKEEGKRGAWYIEKKLFD